jgi:hypothetical protein
MSITTAGLPTESYVPKSNSRLLAGASEVRTGTSVLPVAR